MIPAIFPSPNPAASSSVWCRTTPKSAPRPGSKPRRSFRAPSARVTLGADCPVLRIRVQVGRIIDAVNATVPESMWGEIAARLDDAELVQPSREPPYLRR